MEDKLKAPIILKKFSSSVSSSEDDSALNCGTQSSSSNNICNKIMIGKNIDKYYMNRE